MYAYFQHFFIWHFCCGIICAMIKLLKFICIRVSETRSQWLCCGFLGSLAGWNGWPEIYDCMHACMHALIILLLADAYTRCRRIIWWLAPSARTFACSPSFRPIVRMCIINVGCTSAAQMVRNKNRFIKNIEQLMHTFVSWSVCRCVHSTWEKNQEPRRMGDGRSSTAWREANLINIEKDNKQLSTRATSV